MNTQSFSSKSVVSVVVAMLIMFLMSAQPASARYRDRSDELPGMDNSISPILIVGAVAAAAAVVYMVVSSDDKAADSVDATDDANTEKAPAAPTSFGDDEDDDEWEAAVRTKNMNAIMQMPSTNPCAALASKLPPVMPLVGFGGEQVVVGVGVNI